MSRKTSTIFGEKFDCYGEALYNYLDFKGIDKVWLAERITPEGQKVKSTQEKFSSWKSDCSKPRKTTRSEIDKILGINIEQNRNGKWEIKRTNNGKPKDEQSAANDPGRNYDIDDLTDEARQIARLLGSGKVGEPSRDDRIRALEFAQLMIGYAIESLKKESSDQS